ncbi:MAG: diguanylate cyclase [Burkholderiales bacterium]|nr:diguanylate cyclase [Burkholderiales bacterium]
MPPQASPHEIARETLRRMASRREPPTPTNYRRAYSEVAGEPEADAGPVPGAWLNLLRTLARQTAICHQGITPTQKKQAIDRLLEQNAGEDPVRMYEKLNRLLNQWERLPTAPDESSRAVNSAEAQPELVEMLCKLFAQTVERAVAAQQNSGPELSIEARDIATRLREARDAAAISALAAPLKQLWYRLSLRADDGDQLRQGLIRVLNLLIENVQEITTDDQWLNGQMAAVRKIIAGPLNLEAIDLVERSLRETIVRQGILRHSLSDAKNRLKDMVGSFIGRISELSSMTGEYHDKIDVLATKLRLTDDIGELGGILDDVMTETRRVQSQALQSRDSLTDAQRQVELAEQRIRQLEAELVEASEKVREDQLTGTLNRRGLDEVFEREIVIRRRNERPLSVALLDIDNFKVLNDTYGHQAGDNALKHLANLIRQTIRPTDSVARFGGEEFLIILPDSSPEESAVVVKRLQRSLTKHFFLHDNQKLLITFSAGVTGHALDETQAEVIARADKALYQAKAAGKNRVITT